MISRNSYIYVAIASCALILNAQALFDPNTCQRGLKPNSFFAAFSSTTAAPTGTSKFCRLNYIYKDGYEKRIDKYREDHDELIKDFIEKGRCHPAGTKINADDAELPYFVDLKSALSFGSKDSYPGRIVDKYWIDYIEIEDSDSMPDLERLEMVVKVPDTEEQMAEKAAAKEKARKYCVLNYKYVPNVEEKIGELREEHDEIVESFIAKGRCHPEGPRANPTDPEMPIFNSLEDALAFGSLDPYPRSRIVSEYVIDFIPLDQDKPMPNLPRIEAVAKDKDSSGRRKRGKWCRLVYVYRSNYQRKLAEWREEHDEVVEDFVKKGKCHPAGGKANPADPELPLFVNLNAALEFGRRDPYPGQLVKEFNYEYVDIDEEALSDLGRPEAVTVEKADQDGDGGGKTRYCRLVYVYRSNFETKLAEWREEHDEVVEDFVKKGKCHPAGGKANPADPELPLFVDLNAALEFGRRDPYPGQLVKEFNYEFIDLDDSAPLPDLPRPLPQERAAKRDGKNVYYRLKYTYMDNVEKRMARLREEHEELIEMFKQKGKIHPDGTSVNEEDPNLPLFVDLKAALEFGQRDPYPGRVVREYNYDFIEVE